MSSLLNAIGIAASSLRATQTAISVVSQNVANAQTPNYADESAVTVALPGDGGVQIAGIQRATDAALQQETLAQNAVSGGAAAASALYQQLNDVVGSSASTAPLSSAMQNFQTAWQTYEASPDDQTAAQQVIAAGTSVTQALGQISDGVAQVTQTAQGNVANDVGTLNTDLAQIAQFNQQIVAAQASGTSVPSLDDQRDAAIAAVGGLVSIRTVTQSDGSVSVFTTSGLSLVDKAANSFSWDGTNITSASDGTTSLNSSFSTGSIGATLGFLATDATSVASSDPNVGTLQKLTNQINDFAASLYDTTTTPAPAFEAAYDGATAQTGELASSFFTTSDGAATADAADLVVNPALTDGTAALKQASATPVVAALGASDQSLDAGGLSLSGQTYAGIANAIVANTATNANSASGTATTAAGVASTLSSRLSSQTGVNLDDEMSNLIVLQNSYAAAARVMTTITTMMNSLLAIGQG
jgi:flagellar hook-associated protein 1